MNKRPTSITVISWLFIVFGAVAFVASLLSVVNTDAAHRLPDLKTHWIVHLSRILALLSGVFMLYGFNWARWLLLVWLGFHVIISILHTPFELVMHCLFFAAGVHLLFRPPASAYFRGTSGADTL